MTSRRDFLKGLASGAGLLIARPKLPQVETEPVADASTARRWRGVEIPVQYHTGTKPKRGDLAYMDKDGLITMANGTGVVAFGLVMNSGGEGDTITVKISD